MISNFRIVITFLVFIIIINYNVGYPVLQYSMWPSQSFIPFIFVHMGIDPAFFPTYIYFSVKQAAMWNPKSNFHVVVPSVFSKQLCLLQLENEIGDRFFVWNLEDLPRSQAHDQFITASRFDTSFRAGFWRFTAERLFIVDNLMTVLSISEAVHLENDNLVYVDLSTIINVLRKLYPGLAVTLKSSGQAAAGFFYIGSQSVLMHFLSYLNTYPQKEGLRLEEMSILWTYSSLYGYSKMGYLPIVPPLLSNNLNYSTNIESFNGVFDGAPHGQYLGGHDPRNELEGPGYVTLGLPYRVDEYDYSWTMTPIFKFRRMNLRLKAATTKSLAPTSSASFSSDTLGPQQWYPIFHLHIHCKNLSLFVSF